MAEITHYPDSLSGLDAQFSAAHGRFPATRATALAQRLRDGAVAFDMRRAVGLGLNWKLTKAGLVRDAENPSAFEDVSIIGAEWADDPHNPLEPGERWNAGRRKTLTGTDYALDAQGLPVNPYMNTGLNGRGVLGRMGPNHAVDNGVVVIAKDRITGASKVYFTLGITRKFDNDAPALNGGFAKYKHNEDGSYDFDDEAVLETRLEEFFEEMVSGSVVLLPEFVRKIGDLYEERYNRLLAARGSASLISGDQAGEIVEQVVTALKLEQVKKYDPGFLERLKTHIAGSRECFAGPVLCDTRNTNGSWIESRLAWTVFNDDVWRDIVGDSTCPYRLSGGDDASSVVYHKFGPDLIEKAFASHGAMMTFMAASFLLEAQEKGWTMEPEVLEQMETAALFLESFDKPAPMLAGEPDFSL